MFTIKESLWLNSFKEKFYDLKEFLSFILGNYFGEILFMIELLTGSNNLNSMINYCVYLFSIQCVNFFFDSNRITNVSTVKEINNLTDQIVFYNVERNIRSNCFTSLLTQAKDQRNVTIDIMTQVKTIFYEYFLINVISILIFLLLSYVDAFSLIFDFRFGIVICLNGFVYSISKEFYSLNKVLGNKFYFSNYLIGFVISILFFSVVCFFFNMTPFLFILSCHIGNLYHLVVYLKYLRYFDIRVVILEKVLKVSNENFITVNL